jgi:hypothetical protein
LTAPENESPWDGVAPRCSGLHEWLGFIAGDRLLYPHPATNSRHADARKFEVQRFEMCTDVSKNTYVF